MALSAPLLVEQADDPAPAPFARKVLTIAPPALRASVAAISYWIDSQAIKQRV